jgi:hypothetical protein
LQKLQQCCSNGSNVAAMAEIAAIAAKKHFAENG